jgi:uncharacterized protein YndB with AHSA1/START domain
MADEIHHEVWINASRETVFDAITCQEGLDAWWGPVVNAELTVGSVVEFDHGHGDLLRMKIVDLVPNERLEWECVSNFTYPGNPASEWTGTRLIFELTDGEKTGFDSLDAYFPDGTITVLTFRHTGWADDSRWLAFCSYAWGVTLSGLEAQCTKQESVGKR